MDVLLASARTDLRFAMEVLLREEPGISVIGTATGSAGLMALIETTRPDLVVLDWDLPGRSPVDVLASARSAASPPYVIALGGDSTAERAALRAGVDAFVLRGDRPEQLLAAVRQARSRSGPTAGPDSVDSEGAQSGTSE